MIIVPNNQMETPHFRVVRVRKGDEIGTLSYRLPEKYEAESAAGEEEETQERRAPEQPAINAFAITSDAPVPAQTAATRKPESKRDNRQDKQAPAASEGGFFSRLIKNCSAPLLLSRKKLNRKRKQTNDNNRRGGNDRNKQRRNRRDRNDRNGERTERADRPERSERSDNESRNKRDRDTVNEPRKGRNQNTPNEDLTPEELAAREAQQQLRREQRAERQRRRQDEKRVQQDAKNCVPSRKIRMH